MATISADEVRRLARLARLELSSDEVERFTRQLGDILEFARQVNAVDTSSIDANGGRSDDQASGRLRDDAPQASLDREAVLDSAPEADRSAGLFLVPRVLNE